MAFQANELTLYNRQHRIKLQMIFAFNSNSLPKKPRKHQHAQKAGYYLHVPSQQLQGPSQHRYYHQLGSKSCQYQPHIVKEETYIVLWVNKVPPVLAAESILQRLAGRVIPAGIASIKVGMLRP